MNVLVYQKLSSYRYRIAESVTIDLVNPDLIKQLQLHHQEHFHPFFQINDESITAQFAYSWDGATFVINTTNLVIPSLIHDIGCQAVNLGYLPRSMRQHFDKEYYMQCLKYGVNKYRALLHYSVIRLWGLIPKKEAIAEYATKFTITIK